MIAARPIQDLTRGLGRNAFDLPVAALAGLAAAFIAFVIPADLLGQIVSATGLPHLLAAAEPPLGLKARAGIGIVGAAAAFGFVFMMMRLLDGAGRKKAKPELEPEFEPELDEVRPRLRRRDLHPDAPACRPISAARDFGEPAPPPLELAEAAEPVAMPELAPDPEPLPSWFAEAEVEAEALQAEPLPDPAPPPEPELQAAPEPQAEPAPTPAVEASLPDLMRRLEQGLARRRTRQIFTPAQQQQAQPQAPTPQVFPEANDDRLQSAIESLQRFAARGD